MQTSLLNSVLQHKLKRRLNTMTFHFISLLHSLLIVKGKIKTKATSALFLLICCTNASFANAEVTVSLVEPNWQFLLDSRPIELTSARLASGESSFAQLIKPMLNEKKYKEVADAFAQRDINNDSAALRQLRGQVFLSLKQLDKAEEALLSATELMPNLALAHRSLSMVYMLKKQHDQAAKHLTKSIELGVADAQLYGQLAYINLNNHHAASAIVGYQQALYLDPTNIQWQQGLLYSWLNSNNFSAAKQMVEDMLAQGQHKNPLELWLLHSQIALQMQNHKDALTSLEIALHLQETQKPAPANNAVEFTKNKLLAAKLHIKHGSEQRAVELLTSSLQRFIALPESQNQSIQKDLFATLEQTLNWLFNKQDTKNASHLLDVAQTIKAPSQYQAKINMYQGQLALQQNNVKQAVSYLLSAIQQNPTLGRALLSLAGAYQQQGNYQQAQRYYVRASAIPGIKINALLSNAQLQIEHDHYTQALDLLLEAVKLKPHRQDIRNNIQALQKIIKHKQFS